METEQIRAYLEGHDYFGDYEGVVKHPGDSRQVYGCHLFAKNNKILEEMVTWYQSIGWQAWIVGTNDNIPAAYLYKEIE